MWSYSYFEKLLGITKNLIGNHGRSLFVDFGCDKVASFNIINEVTSSFVLFNDVSCCLGRPTSRNVF